MDYEDFIASLQQPAPPAGLSLALQALWFEGNKNWTQAHELAQQDEGRDGAWVHAYLHRVEGDLGNAAYWYRRAGQPVQSVPLAQEWEALVRALLAQSDG